MFVSYLLEVSRDVSIEKSNKYFGVEIGNCR